MHGAMVMPVVCVSQLVARALLRQSGVALWVTGALLVLLPAPAQGARVTSVGADLSYTGGAEANDVGFEVIRNGTAYRVFENADTPVDVGAGCRRRERRGAITCSARRVRRLRISLGRGGDSLRLIDRLQARVEYSGGSGFDGVVYLGNQDVPLRVSADGRANDGRSRRDNIAADVEYLPGGGLDDRLVAGPHASLLTGGSGDDSLVGGSGDDRLAGAGFQTIEEVDYLALGRDALSCGAGRDFVLAGAEDSVARDCEIVLRQRTVPGPPGMELDSQVFGPSGAYHFELRGTPGRDVLKLGGDHGLHEDFASPVRILGRGGDDRLTVAYGSDALFGSSGNDVLRADLEPRSRDSNWLVGGSGRDRVFSRDRSRDLVSCGPGLDAAYADRLDEVAGDCERVARR